MRITGCEPPGGRPGSRRRAPALARRWRAGLALGAAAVAIAVAGCAGSSSSAASGPAAASGSAAAGPAAGQHVTIEGTNRLRFSPMTVHVRTGAVKVTLKDMGAYPHNLVIPALHVTSTTVTGDPGGGTTSFTVTFARPGRYAFHCQYHQSSGMVGVFVVS
jgi:plastocyanin